MEKSRIIYSAFADDFIKRTLQLEGMSSLRTAVENKIDKINTKKLFR